MKTKRFLAFLVSLIFFISFLIGVKGSNVYAISNLAIGKSPSSSVPFENISRITDGDKNTYMYSTTGYAGSQWIQIDLGSSYSINDIKLWHYYGDARSYNDVIVQLSNDETFSSNVSTVFNNDTDNSSGLGAGSDSEYKETSTGKDISFSALNARFARFYTNGNTVNKWNHYVEVEMYSSAEIIHPTLVTLNKTTDTLQIGQQDTLTATVLPENASDKNVIWSSSAPNVATVSSTGLITPVTEGTSNITATTVDGSITTSCAVTVVKSAAPSQVIYKMNTSSKIIALTFDDCAIPENLSAIIGILSNNNVKATFFTTGKSVEENPALFKQAFDAGNQIANHSYSHQYLPNLTFDQMLSEINKGETAIINATGQSAKPFFRVPYFGYSSSVLQALGDAGYSKAIDCNIDPADWDPNVTVDQIVQRVVGNVSPGSIAVLHINVNSGNTVYALPVIIGKLKDQRYRFLTISELLSYISVTGVTLNNTSLTIDIGQIINLQATINPVNATEKGLIWSSSNEAAAVVDSTGKVTGIANGNTTITVTTIDGGMTASCNVIVASSSVPSGNLAAGKLISSSVPFQSISRITDGDKNAYMYATTGYTGSQWIQIDLGSSYPVNDIKLWHYYGDTRSYHDVIVQLSNDATFSSNVTTAFNNDTDNSSGLGTGSGSEYKETSTGKDISFSAVNARYARFYTNGNTINNWNHYVEVEIYGQTP